MNWLYLPAVTHVNAEKTGVKVVTVVVKEAHEET